MELNADDFTLFGLPTQFAQDRSAIDARWKQLQTEVHPDRFVSEGPAAQRIAMQWAVRVNEAYQRLKDPMKRAAYLCELRGAAIEAENNTAMPTDFLMQQMEWREALEAAKQADAVERIADEVMADRAARLQRLERLLDQQHDTAGAAREVRALMFIERFYEDIDRRLAAYDR